MHLDCGTLSDFSFFHVSVFSKFSDVNVHCFCRKKKKESKGEEKKNMEYNTGDIL